MTTFVCIISICSLVFTVCTCKTCLFVSWPKTKKSLWGCQLASFTHPRVKGPLTSIKDTDNHRFQRWFIDSIAPDVILESLGWWGLENWKKNNALMMVVFSWKFATVEVVSLITWNFHQTPPLKPTTSRRWITFDGGLFKGDTIDPCSGKANCYSSLTRIKGHTCGWSPYQTTNWGCLVAIKSKH